MKKIIVFILFSFNFVVFSQFTDTASMRIIEQNKSAGEGDLYLDTNAKVYKIGLTNGQLGWITDNQRIDSLKVINDSLFVFLERGENSGIHLDSLNINKDNVGLNYYMWDIPNTSTPNISNKTALGIPDNDGSMVVQLDNTHRNLIAASPQEGYILLYSGKLKVHNTGSFTFDARSDDGSRIYIDGVMVVENWFQQGATTRSGTATLAKGEHKIEFWYYENVGGDHMEFFWGANPDGYLLGSYILGSQFFIK
jgi:hypothetical protein